MHEVNRKFERGGEICLVHPRNSEPVFLIVFLHAVVADNSVRLALVGNALEQGIVFVELQPRKAKLHQCPCAVQKTGPKVTEGVVIYVVDVKSL